jgi:hypothetical protein
VTRLKLSDLKNVLEEDLPYSIIVDYLRFLSAFGRGTKVSSSDEDLMVALKVESPQYASQKMTNLYLNELVRREPSKITGAGRRAFQYYVPK